MWNKKSGIYFQLEMNKLEDAYLLANLAVKGLNDLEGDGVHVDYLELHFIESLLDSAGKQAYIKVDCRGRTFIFSERYLRWYDMLMSSLDSIHDYCGNRKAAEEFENQQGVSVLP